eukprot:CAMPEP_0175167620 /NCGR_PEP_ID=MMETSP0087-20121206/28452_1 /TAXON_ID=136419 /ORGANISM="Unknown Unknown, Strain D1" /LENGTH=500 /DNA_ID=CAMNT_0016457547 /DNA_START=128 /DNA_END=1630 /DNA_ORIENTATION=-
MERLAAAREGEADSLRHALTDLQEQLSKACLRADSATHALSTSQSHSKQLSAEREDEKRERQAAAARAEAAEGTVQRLQGELTSAAAHLQQAAAQQQQLHTQASALKQQLQAQQLTAHTQAQKLLQFEEKQKVADTQREKDREVLRDREKSVQSLTIQLADSERSKHELTRERDTLSELVSSLRLSYQTSAAEMTQFRSKAEVRAKQLLAEKSRAVTALAAAEDSKCRLLQEMELQKELFSRQAKQNDRFLQETMSAKLSRVEQLRVEQHRAQLTSKAEQSRNSESGKPKVPHRSVQQFTSFAANSASSGSLLTPNSVSLVQPPPQQQVSADKSIETFLAEISQEAEQQLRTTLNNIRSSRTTAPSSFLHSSKDHLAVPSAVSSSSRVYPPPTTPAPSFGVLDTITPIPTATSFSANPLMSPFDSTLPFEPDATPSLHSILSAQKQQHSGVKRANLDEIPSGQDRQSSKGRNTENVESRAIHISRIAGPVTPLPLSLEFQ